MCGDHRDFDTGAFGQGLDCHSFSSRVWRWHRVAVGRIHVGVIVHGGEKHGGFDHVVQRQSGFAKDGLSVGDALARGPLHVVPKQFSCLRNQGDLAAHEHQGACLGGLAVCGHRLGAFVGVDALAHGTFVPAQS